MKGFGCEVKNAEDKKLKEESNSLEDLMSDFQAAGGR